MRNSLTRALAGTAITVVAVGVAAGAAVAGTNPPARTATTLSISASAATITGGSKETITGTLAAGTTDLSGQRVYLAEVAGKRVFPISGARTSTSGVASFTFVPFGTATYELVYRGSKTYAGSHSGTATVTVNKTATALSISPSATSIAGGSKETITGTLTAGTTDLGGQHVYLAEVAGKRVFPVRRGITAKTTGVVSFTFRPFSTATYELVYTGTPVYAGSHSSTAAVTVNKTATAVTIAAASASIAKGATDTITGTLTAGTTPVSGQRVYLVVVGSKKRLHPIRAERTSSTGAVSFTVAPKTSTTYELVFPATYTLAGSVSGTVTVTVTS
jgi:hypothetical protein